MLFCWFTPLGVSAPSTNTTSYAELSYMVHWLFGQVKHRNTSAYNRLKALCEDPQRRFFVFANEYHAQTFIAQKPKESPNDRNDRAIRVAAAWCVHS